MMCLQRRPWPLLCPGKTIDSELSSDDKGCIGHTSHVKDPKKGWDNTFKLQKQDKYV